MRRRDADAACRRRGIPGETGRIVLTPEEHAWAIREERRRRQRRRTRNRRRGAAALLVVVVAASAIGGYAFTRGADASRPRAAATGGTPSIAATPSGRPRIARAATRKKKAKPPTTTKTSTIPPKTQTTARATTTTRTTTAHAAAGSVSPAGALTVPGVRIVQDPIPYGSRRRAEMARYALRHYGIETTTVTPKLIVLHITAGPTYASAHETFSTDAPSAGPAGSAAELPGTCSQFIVDQDGTVYQQTPVTLICRHTIGVNQLAIGIEMVQAAAGSSHAADQAILDRPAQIHAVLDLVRALGRRYSIPASRVIGHAMANASPLFHDAEGWRNDHSDWQPDDVAELRRRL